MTCMKITESQNDQIYPEDTFSHSAAHFFSKGGLIVYLAALKKGAIRAAHPYYVIYR